jgi:pimeloyl-ACP methyl ester carboxylesterase
MPESDRSKPVALTVEPIDGLMLSGEAAGEGSPLVLVHGLTATRRNVVQGSRHLLKRGRRLIAYDARGHGESSPAPGSNAYGYADLAADLRAVADDLALDRFTLAGSSMGAATGVQFALAQPERVSALVLITPAHLGERPAPEALVHWERIADALARGDLEGFIDAAVPDALPERWREPVRLATRQRIERHRHIGAVADAVRVVARDVAFAGVEAIAELEIPVLVVGSRDVPDPGHPLSIAEEYARRLPRGELVVEDEGETPLAWQGARLSRAIGDFLDRAQV